MIKIGETNKITLRKKELGHIFMGRPQQKESILDTRFMAPNSDAIEFERLMTALKDGDEIEISFPDKVDVTDECDSCIELDDEGYSYIDIRHNGKSIGRVCGNLYYADEGKVHIDDNDYSVEYEGQHFKIFRVK